MNEHDDISATSEQISRQSAELTVLLRMLSISEGTFSLSIAICNSPALRNYLISKITEEKAGIEQIPIEKNCPDMLAFAKEKITVKRPSAIFITEIENALPSDDVQPRIIRNLNASRERWQQEFSCPVVFWLPEYAATMLQKDALDFASWISHIFEFVSEQATAMAGTQDAYAGHTNTTSAGRLDANQKRFRIAELEQRIEDAGDPPESRFAQHVLTWLYELAYIYDAVGDLDTAEKNILKSLKISKKLGRLGSIASAYGNLGILYRKRGVLDKAEQMHKRALEIDEKLERLDGMAGHYGNLGLIYRRRGDLDKAEQMHRKSLEIEEKLGRLESMAIQYANLGLVYRDRGDLYEAKQMFKKALEIDVGLERFEGMARQYGNLGQIYTARGDLDSAEQMHTKALEIDEKLGQLEGMAVQYANLGLVYRTRGDIEKTGEYWEKALELYKKIGMKPDIEMVQGWIDGLRDKGKGQSKS